MLNLDTHILLYALQGNLKPSEKKLLVSHPWSISCIVLWEISKLCQLKRIDLDLDDAEVIRTLSKIHTWPLSLEVCKNIHALDFKSDPADEIIAATSLTFNVPLLTRDKKIKRSKCIPLA